LASLSLSKKRNKLEGLPLGLPFKPGLIFSVGFSWPYLPILD
jgi:hypothetical protein